VGDVSECEQWRHVGTNISEWNSASTFRVQKWFFYPKYWGRTLVFRVVTSRNVSHVTRPTETAGFRQAGYAGRHVHHVYSEYDNANCITASVLYFLYELTIPYILSSKCGFPPVKSDFLALMEIMDVYYSAQKVTQHILFSFTVDLIKTSNMSHHYKNLWLPKPIFQHSLLLNLWPYTAETGEPVCLRGTTLQVSVATTSLHW
jgi:hypothetical protein